MEPDAVQTENKPLECRVVLIRRFTQMDSDLRCSSEWSLYTTKDTEKREGCRGFAQIPTGWGITRVLFER